jgi:acetate kinase
VTNGIVVINAGSSSLKFAVYAASALAERPVLRGQVEEIGAAARLLTVDPLGESLVAEAHAPTHAEALGLILRRLEEDGVRLRIVAAGHRIVHGGERFTAPVRVDGEVLEALRALIPLAPRHQPHNLGAIEALAALRPELEQVACFDTAFHRTQPEIARRFALPEELHAAGLRRYGFHGLSYESIAEQLPAHLGASAAEGRVVVAHLGNGASAVALRARQSVATSMGLTPLDGLVMGTRPGALDPGVLLYLMRERGFDEPRLSRLLYDQSGLRGVSGISHDVRTLLASDEPSARLALDLFVYRLVREVGALAALLEGLDALVFTGGIGENAAGLRAATCAHLAWLGLELDPSANEGHGPRISTSQSRVSAWAIATDEEGRIARHTARVLELG